MQIVRNITIIKTSTPEDFQRLVEYLRMARMAYMPLREKGSIVVFNTVKTDILNYQARAKDARIQSYTIEECPHDIADLLPPAIGIITETVMRRCNNDEGKIGRLFVVDSHVRNATSWMARAQLYGDHGLEINPNTLPS
ncbi:MAG: hypothetical protein LIP02_09185 [Bacteroidales bacterium]|nr:hypothetical protein [Bacteroidales bacterium]